MARARRIWALSSLTVENVSHSSSVDGVGRLSCIVVVVIVVVMGKGIVVSYLLLIVHLRKHLATMVIWRRQFCKNNGGGEGNCHNIVAKINGGK
jgi:hypothetical protein